MMVISPHCDDAVFACGERIGTRAGTLVVTVLAGDAPRGTPLTPWDRDCGFRDGDAVMAARRAEDRCAFARLGARGEWLPFRDRQYGVSPSAVDVAKALEDLVRRVSPADVCFPLGLFHSDHVLVSDAALELVGRHPRTAWHAYEDALYRALDHAVEERVTALRRRGFRLAPAAATTDATALGRKRRAIACYRSQLRGLRTPARLGHRDALAAETYWSIRA